MSDLPAETAVVPPTPGFAQFGLAAPLLQALEEVGYEEPSAIQAESIPPLLAGRDLLGQAQTGTGKTAAFALPLLSRLQLDCLATQVLVLAPTRELAIQVAEAFQRYARHLPGFHVVPIYGGQSYDIQLRQLRRGAHVVVGTPGRVMDHMRRGTLQLDGLTTLVLDEADEMLRMGFLEDVEWVLQQIPPTRQVALFSATLPAEIRRVVEQHLHDPVEVRIAQRTLTAETIHQRYWQVSGLHKLDALTRLLEVEPFDAVLIFVRTKTATVDLAERLEARGHACEALNGDIPQPLRERIVERLRGGQLDILVATDVVARGLDVERISHVINYDIPTDVEAYIHRIGRTGRAGRTGEAILFVSPRERRLLRAIERTIRQSVEPMHMPTAADVNQQRILRFKEKVREQLAEERNELFYQLLTDLQQEQDAEPLEIAAALASLLQGEEPMLLSESPRLRKKGGDQPQTEPRGSQWSGRGDRGGEERDARPPRAGQFRERREGGQFQPNAQGPGGGKFRERRERGRFQSDAQGPGAGRFPPQREWDPRKSAAGGDRLERRKPGTDEPAPRPKRREDVGMEKFRIAVGYRHGVKPGNIVGAIANEAGLDSQYIGHIDIHEDYSTVDLPVGMPKEVFQELKRVRVCQQPLEIRRVREGDAESGVRGGFKSGRQGRARPQR